MSLIIGRLTIDDPEAWPEPVGEAVARVGATPVPGDRQGHSVQTSLTSFTGAVSDTSADRQRIRRQLRSMLNNLLYRSHGIFIAWSEDEEQNGWYVPGSATFEVAGDGGLASAFWRFAGLDLALLGRPRTHRRAAEARVRDLTIAVSPRDTRKRIYSTNYSSLQKFGLLWLPSGATDVLVSWPWPTQRLAGPRYGSGGSVLYGVFDPVDLSVISYEQPADHRNRGDVVIYDRRGSFTAPVSGPDPAWEEVYGPDYPLTAGDVPVLDNSLCRVRWSVDNTPGAVIDIWDGSAYSEVCKVIFSRREGSNFEYCNWAMSANVYEWTPERAIVGAIMRVSSNSNSREEVIVTLQRGWKGPKIEIYPALMQDGKQASGGIWVFTPQNSNTSVSFIPSGVVNLSTAGTGTTFFSQNSGDAPANDNFIGVLQEGAPFALGMGLVISDKTELIIDSANYAYGSQRNSVAVYSTPSSTGFDGIGYSAVIIGAYKAHADQVIEAESMSLGGGTSVVSDSAASGGEATVSTRNTDGTHVYQFNWCSTSLGIYRVFVRARGTGGIVSVRATTNTTIGVISTTSSTTYVWLDLGDIEADGSALTISAWASSGSVYIDRIECHKMRAWSGPDPQYDGVRDLARVALADVIGQPTVIAK